MIVFSVDTVDGGDHIATTDVLPSFETWVTPVFAIPSQASVWRVELTIVHVPIICPLVCVFAINKTPSKISLLVEPLTVTAKRKK
jgi:hypothetical protein